LKLIKDCSFTNKPVYLLDVLEKLRFVDADLLKLAGYENTKHERFQIIKKNFI
jgi:hypothetical protein